MWIRTAVDERRAEVAELQCAQHEIIVSCYPVARVEPSRGVYNRATHVEGRMGRHPPPPERAFLVRRTTPAPHDFLTFLVGHEIEVAEGDVRLAQCGGDPREYATIGVTIIGIEKPNGIAAEQGQALVGGVIQPLIRLRNDADAIGRKRRDDFQRVVREAPSTTISSLSA